MEEAVAEHLVEERRGALAHHGIGIVARRRQWRRGRRSACRRPAPASSRAARCGPSRWPARDRPDRRRNSRPAPRPPRPPCADPSRPAPRRRRRCTEFDGLQPAEARLGALDQLGHPVEEIEIAREGLLDTGPQHLHRDVAAVGGDGEMHLGDRGGGDRHVLELREQRVDRPAKLELDRCARASAPGNAGRWSCSRARSAATSSLSRSARVESAWPSLMKPGPSPAAPPPAARPAGANRGGDREEPRPGDQRRGEAQHLERKQRVVAREAQRHAAGASCCEGAEHIAPLRSASPSAAPRRRASCCARRRWRSPPAHARCQLALRREAADAFVQVPVGSASRAITRPKNGSARSE